MREGASLQAADLLVWILASNPVPKHHQKKFQSSKHWAPQTSLLPPPQNRHISHTRNACFIEAEITCKNIISLVKMLQSLPSQFIKKIPLKGGVQRITYSPADVHGNIFPIMRSWIRLEWHTIFLFLFGQEGWEDSLKRTCSGVSGNPVMIFCQSSTSSMPKPQNSVLLRPSGVRRTPEPNPGDEQEPPALWQVMLRRLCGARNRSMVQCTLGIYISYWTTAPSDPIIQHIVILPFSFQ